MTKRLKHKLVFRDGKIIDIANEKEEPRKEGPYIGKNTISKGLKWGQKGYQETRISTNERGQREIFKEVKK
tara:strand:+ start:1288 stop:1500 length:213 start_codon:yes stop_codon:yes gene_type:complete